jgi:hypothetical protein
MVLFRLYGVLKLQVWLKQMLVSIGLMGYLQSRWLKKIQCCQCILAIAKVIANE